jgi:hypothetical protein
MSFWDGVASFGLGVQGYNDYTDSRADRDYLAAKRKRDEEVQGIELEKLRREDDLAKTTRAIAARNGLGGADQLPAVNMDVPIKPLVPMDDEGNPMPVASKSVNLPAGSNRIGMYNEMADAQEKAGKLAEAEKIRTAIKAIESEGYSDIIKGVASGEEPAAIAQRFNQKGAKRIVNAEKKGDGYLFTYEDGKSQAMDKNTANDLGEKLGIFKREKPTVVASDASLVDDHGKVLYKGTPKPKNIDPLSPEGIAVKKDFESWKATLAKKEGGDPAKIREVRALADLAFGGDIEKATEYAYGVKDQDRTSQVMRMMGILRNDDTLAQDPKKLQSKAEEIVDGLRTKSTTTRGGVRPTKSDNAPDIQSEIEAANKRDAAAPPKTLTVPGTRSEATFTGRYTRNRKPIYQSADGQQYVGE